MPTDLAVRAFAGDASLTTYNFDPLSTEQNSGVLGHGSSIAGGSSIGLRIDRDIAGVSQDELTLGAEKAFGGTLSVGLKGTYRRLNRAMEDRCDLDPTLAENAYSQCALMNPGSSAQYARGDFFSCTGLDFPYNNCFDEVAVFGAAAVPKARRIYRGLELMARETIGGSLWVQASYVFSSLRGNYDGAVSEARGQTDPGTNFDFDYPPMLPDDDGRLFLDRPHLLRLDGFSITPWEISIGLQAWLRSGAPRDRLGYLNEFYGAAVPLAQRGQMGRLPMEWDANLTVAYPVRIGSATVTLQAYVFNVFNNQIATSTDAAWTITTPDGYPASLEDPNQPRNNPDYGRVDDRSDPRLFRAAIRVSF
jgi:hypothetical protein